MSSLRVERAIPSSWNGLFLFVGLIKPKKTQVFKVLQKLCSLWEVKNRLSDPLAKPSEHFYFTELILDYFYVSDNPSTLN
jgi:hypothetical protein